MLAGGAITGVLIYKASWHMVWHDEFGGRSVNRSHWNIRNNTFSTNEDSALTSRPRNVSVGDGTLRLTALREEYTVRNTTRHYTSGYLDTIGKKSWKYGKFEVRAKLPASQGLWPAFWLRADNGLGEIDIMESVGGIRGFTAQSVHQSTQGGQGKSAHDDTLPGGASTSTWHVYAVLLQPDAVTWTIDGQQVYRVTTSQQPWLRSVFDRPLNIRLNLQVNGTMPDYYHHPVTSASTFPATYTIDWVRVYQHG